MSACSLAGKVVIITGASSGLGRATAIHFASLGSKLVVCGRNEAALQGCAVVDSLIQNEEPMSGAGPSHCMKDQQETVSKCAGADDVISIVGDVTVEIDVVNIIERTIEHYKQLDVLVNNAGLLRSGSIEDSPLEQFDKIMSTNVRSVYHLTMLAVPHLIATKGAIVNVSSVHGIRPNYSLMTYSMSKAALDQFTRCVALDLAPKQVRVNSVNPGLVATNLFRDTLPAEQLAPVFDHLANLYPLGRLGEPEDVAKAIAFLASSESSFSTGSQLLVDGGFNLALPR